MSTVSQSEPRAYRFVSEECQFIATHFITKMKRTGPDVDVRSVPIDLTAPTDLHDLTDVADPESPIASEQTRNAAASATSALSPAAVSYASPQAARTNLRTSKGHTNNNNNTAAARSNGYSKLRSPCPVCLCAAMDNACVLDACSHAFCLSCIISWVKIGGPVCPMCRRSFGAVYHSVVSPRDFQTLLVSEFSTFLPDDDIDIDNDNDSDSPIITQPHPQSPSPSSSSSLLPSWLSASSHRSPFSPHHARRRSVYTRGLASLPFRNSPNAGRAPSFYAQVLLAAREMSWSVPLVGAKSASDRSFRLGGHMGGHVGVGVGVGGGGVAASEAARVLPWVRRELEALLQTHDTHLIVRFVFLALSRFPLSDRALVEHLEVYLREDASAFVHELSVFLASPYSMSEYDRVVENRSVVAAKTETVDLESDSDSDSGDADEKGGSVGHSPNRAPFPASSESTISSSRMHSSSSMGRVHSSSRHRAGSAKEEDVVVVEEDAHTIHVDDAVDTVDLVRASSTGASTGHRTHTPTRTRTSAAPSSSVSQLSTSVVEEGDRTLPPPPVIDLSD